MNPLTFRPASSADAELAAELFLDGKALDRPAAVELFKNEFFLCETVPDRRTFILAWDDTSLIAYAGARFYDPQQDENMYGTSQLLPAGWYLRGLKVRIKWRRTGVARELTRRRIEWLSARTKTVFVFLNDEKKETRPMYHQLGFEMISTGWEFLEQNRKRHDQRGILLGLNL
jgi:GNAT superfamily N-acetyltransferase